MWVVQKLIDCLPCNLPFLKRKDSAKKTDSANTDEKRNLENLEAGTTDDGWEFDNWENKARQPTHRPPSIPLQKLDDFDGMAPVKVTSEAANEPDFFGSLGLKPQYQPPKQIEVKKTPSKTLWAPNDDDEDIDIEGESDFHLTDSSLPLHVFGHSQVGSLERCARRRKSLRQRVSHLLSNKSTLAVELSILTKSQECRLRHKP